MDIKQLSVELLTPNDYNPNALSEVIFSTLERDIQKNGIQAPLLVRPDKEKEGNYIIIDGEHRWKIAQKLGLKELPCKIEDIDDNEAKIQTVSMNRLRGEFDQVKLAAVLTDLRKVYTDAELEDRLGFSVEELKSYEELINFSPESLSTDEIADLEKDLADISDKEKMLNDFLIQLDLLQLDFVETALAAKGADRAKALTELCQEYLKTNAPDKYAEVLKRSEELKTVSEIAE